MVGVVVVVSQPFEFLALEPGNSPGSGFLAVTVRRQKRRVRQVTRSLARPSPRPLLLPPRTSCVDCEFTVGETMRGRGRREAHVDEAGNFRPVRMLRVRFTRLHAWKLLPCTAHP